MRSALLLIALFLIAPAQSFMTMFSGLAAAETLAERAERPEFGSQGDEVAAYGGDAWFLSPTDLDSPISDSFDAAVRAAATEAKEGAMAMDGAEGTGPARTNDVMKRKKRSIHEVEDADPLDEVR